MSKSVSRREFLQIAGLTAGVAALAACVPAPAPGAAQSGPSSERIKLIYTTWGFGNWEDFIQMFNESQTKIEATFEQVAYDAYREKMLTSFAAGQSADVVEISSAWMAEFMSKALLADLDPFMANDPNLSMDKWLPNVFMNKMHTWEGVTYGLPSGDSPKVIWWNMDLFEQEGVKTPLEYEKEGAWNWDNFHQTVLQLTKGEGRNQAVRLSHLDGPFGH